MTVTNARRPIAELGACTLIILVCIAVLWQASKLPPGTFEPLGSAPVPQFTSAIVILCCLVVMVGALKHIRRTAGLLFHIRDEVYGRSPYGAIVMFGSTIVYVLMLQLRVASFGLLTFLFLLSVIWALNNFRSSSLVSAAVTAAIFGFGTQFVFTRVFVVDLPV